MKPVLDVSALENASEEECRYAMTTLHRHLVTRFRAAVIIACVDTDEQMQNVIENVQAMRAARFRERTKQRSHLRLIRDESPSERIAEFARRVGSTTRGV